MQKTNIFFRSASEGPSNECIGLKRSPDNEDTSCIQELQKTFEGILFSKTRDTPMSCRVCKRVRCRVPAGYIRSNVYQKNVALVSR